MLDVQLVNAGFYEISWPEAPGATYVRPGRRESVRVYVPQASPEVEVYAGDLKNGRLVYRGPADHEACLRWLAERQN
ncbi:hypothetical protein [Hymenobacter sp. CRA2]|uniref:hypothetical protein n=1 Tax=Hymenobacter sp. CRA2 TaxID=1955620 RepID=UPI00098F862C|nr:hypothetical protein [Hymenobacter sp. CRA2]OON66987.1 hypothetical protein B0919_20635 [Hymenobacter sp. CRA2]